MIDQETTLHVLRTISAGRQGKSKGVPKQDFELIRKYLWRHGYITRSVATGDYAMNDRGLELMGRLGKQGGIL